MNDERDNLIDRAARALSPLPAVKREAVARIAATARAHRLARPSRLSLALEWMREPTLSAASAGFLAAAALILGFVSRGALKALDGGASALTSTAEMPVPAGATAALAVANDGSAARAVSVPLVFDASAATSVSIVGDFNDWDPRATPMLRFGSDGPWTATVRATPGRHTYAFLVDGVKLVADPRAPKTRDLDYGGETSVLMVTTP